ncbi:hypothetical protein TOPH_04047 [Tolypocladium ophioglossoides CBS 100239]|uniref:Uncharacterized protein n=1 Tax=Tolypocladium ophioglossoides (strain CBS 100239) TaxID=1163406 RepID=A0A0L0NBP4_TOLOC|nr:hypothetical protein TOPH_04047 [Tolypocladium ophioglossoides CBS 100239]
MASRPHARQPLPPVMAAATTGLQVCEPRRWRWRWHPEAIDGNDGAGRHGQCLRLSSEYVSGNASSPRRNRTEADLSRLATCHPGPNYADKTLADLISIRDPSQNGGRTALGGNTRTSPMSSTRSFGTLPSGKRLPTSPVASTGSTRPRSSPLTHGSSVRLGPPSLTRAAPSPSAPSAEPAMLALLRSGICDSPSPTFSLAPSFFRSTWPAMPLVILPCGTPSSLSVVPVELLASPTAATFITDRTPSNLQAFGLCSKDRLFSAWRTAQIATLKTASPLYRLVPGGGGDVGRHTP